MTLIVKYGDIGAVDRKSVWGNSQATPTCKIRERAGDRVLVSLGNTRISNRLARWIIDGANEADWPFKDVPDEYNIGEIVVFYRDRTEMFNSEVPFPLVEKYEFMPQGVITFGVADEFALGWLLAQPENPADRKAVLRQLFETAARNFDGVGPEPDFFDIVGLKRSGKR